MSMVLRKCADCDRRAVPDSPYCDADLRRHLAEAFAERPPEWRRRGLAGENSGKDLTGASR